MDTCGSRTLVKIKLNSESLRGRQHKVLPKAVVLFTILLFSISILGGCTTIKYGSPPRINKLETLKVGGSNKTDVRQSLGEPRGYGAALFSSVPKLSDIWFYEFYVSQGSKTSLALLLVFFDEDLYEGHLWFSGTQLIDTRE
jgi:hypothetical protein